VIDAVYKALFGREAEAKGKQEYIEGFNNEKYTAATIALDILNGAQNSDKTTLESKLKVANLFTLVADGSGSRGAENFGKKAKPFATYVGDSDADAARAMLAKVTSPSSELTYQDVWKAVKAITDAGDPIVTESAPRTPTDPKPTEPTEPDNEVLPPLPPPPPNTVIYLSPFTDNAEGDDSLNNIFRAELYGSSLSLNAADVINGKGGINTLEVELGGSGANGLQNATITNVQTAKIKSAASNIVLNKCE